MEENTYPYGSETAIFHAIVPTEMLDIGFAEVKMPLLFVQKDTDFKQWYEKKKHTLVVAFENEYHNEKKNRSNCYTQSVYDRFVAAWSHENYYQDLIELFRDEAKKTLSEKKEIRKKINLELLAKWVEDGGLLTEEQQEAWDKNVSLCKRINDALSVELYCKAAIYFINETKAFVKPDFGIPDIVPPIVKTSSLATTTKPKEPKKPKGKQKTALDELANQLSKDPNVVVQWAIDQAANKARYSSDNVWKLYRKVKKGELKHEQLTVIIGSKNESN